MPSVTILPATRRLLAALLSALLGEGSFTAGRPEAQGALTRLADGLCRWLEKNPAIALCGGNPGEPLRISILGFGEELIDPALVVEDEESKEVQIRLAGFWRDRRLALIYLRKGLTASEFINLYHLLTHHAGKGQILRNHLYKEQTSGHLPHVSLIFLDDLSNVEPALSWPARVSLAWLYRDFNLLARAHGLSKAEQLDWREQLLVAALELPRLSGKLTDFFAHLDLIAEDVDNFDKDELALALMGPLNDPLPGEICLQLCARLELLQPKDDEDLEPKLKKRRVAIQWIARRLAEQMMAQGKVGPEHLHALVLRKVLLYEEIPEKMRPRVAILQVLTSFLANPQKYFAEVESSSSPEVFETRLWRILGMLPKLVQVLRFDVARQVLEFSQRFGPSFDLQNKPEIMNQLMDAAAGVLTETQREQQTALMQTLPQMGRAGVRLLIDLADHHNRSVRRTAIDALIKTGQPIVPILFETLEVKEGWHYLRNMLLLLAQLNAGGPKVEKFFHKCLIHPEANVRKEALPGIARLLRGAAAAPVAEALDDLDLEVKKRAAACLGLTGIVDPQVYNKLAEILATRACSEELAIQIVASINRLKPLPPESPQLEAALLNLLGTGGFLGMGRRKGSVSQALRIAAVQALGYVGTSRSRKALVKQAKDQNVTMVRAVTDALDRLSARSV